LKIRPEEISNLIKTEIQNYRKSLDIKTSGSVVEVGDGIARIYGLSNAKAGELLEFASGVKGMVLNLEENNVGAVILGDAATVKEGDEVKATGKVASVPAGESLLGRVVDALGEPIACRRGSSRWCRSSRCSWRTNRWKRSNSSC